MYNVSLGGLNMRIKLWKVEQYHNPLEKKVGNSVNTSLCTMYVTSPHDLGCHSNKLLTNLNVFSGLVYNKIFDWMNLNNMIYENQNYYVHHVLLVSS
jgi:hypothetical protein